jgi:hypothetical protein
VETWEHHELFRFYIFALNTRAKSFLRAVLCVLLAALSGMVIEVQIEVERGSA